MLAQMNDDATTVRLAQLEHALRETEERLHRQEAELALLYHAAPLGLCELDTNLRYLRINERLAHMNGRPVSAHLGRTIGEVVPEVAAEAEPQLRSVLRTGCPIVGVDLAGRTPADPGMQRHWRAQYWPLKDDTGAVYAVSVILEEVTHQEQLKEALERESEFRTLAENSTDVIVRYARDLTRAYANPAIKRVLGWTPREAIGKRNHELGVPPDLAEKWDAHLRTAFDTGRERTMEFWVPTAGGPRYLQSRLVPEINTQGEINTLLGITRDLTRNKQIEEALRGSEEQFREVLQLVPDILYRATLPDHSPTFVSSAIERVLGFSPIEWVAEPQLWRRYMSEDDYARVMTEVAAAAPHADRMVIRYRIWDKDRKHLHWFEDRVHFQRNERGQAVAQFGVMTDITDRVRAEEALHHREQEFRALVERSLDVVARQDRDLRFVYVNPAVEHVSGRRPSFFINKPVQALNLPKDVESVFVEQVQSVFATGEDRRFTFQIGGPDGSRRFFDTRVVPELGTDGSVKYVISVTREISRLHEAEERLRRTVDELEMANRRLETLSRTDSLTGLANRRYLFEYLDNEWRRESRHERPISLIVADIDHFKAYNDQYGHLAGDDCLRRVAQALRTQIHRPGDLLARYGGEEFVVILPETNAEGACEIAESMRRAVVNLDIGHLRSPIAPHITISLGVAAVLPKNGRTDDLFAMADTALYRAKEGGRNRVDCEVVVPRLAPHSLT